MRAALLVMLFSHILAGISLLQVNRNPSSVWISCDAMLALDGFLRYNQAGETMTRWRSGWNRSARPARNASEV